MLQIFPPHRGFCFVPVEILPLCVAVLQGPRCFSKYWTAYFQHSGVTSHDWSYLKRKPGGRGKQGVRNGSFRGKSYNPFVCLFCLSFLKCSFFGLDKLLNFWSRLFELTHSHHPKGPIALLAYRCDRKQSIASQRSSLKLLSPEFLLAFSYIGVVDNISTILPCLHVGLISPRGSNPHTSSDFVGLCEMTNLPTWVIPLLK